MKIFRASIGKGSAKSSASLTPENDQSEKFRTAVAPEDKGYGELTEHVISVTLSNMTSAVPLSMVLSLFSERKEGRRGHSGGHV